MGKDRCLNVTVHNTLFEECLFLDFNRNGCDVCHELKIFQIKYSWAALVMNHYLCVRIGLIFAPPACVEMDGAKNCLVANLSYNIGSYAYRVARIFCNIGFYSLALSV